MIVPDGALNAVVTLDVAAAQAPVGGRALKVLFLGQEATQPHNPAGMYSRLAPPLARRGIQLTYVATPDMALTAEKLKHYDAVLISGDHTNLAPDQEKALIDFEIGRAHV